MDEINYLDLPVEAEVPIPPTTRGGRIGEKSPLTEKLMAISVGQSFMVPIVVPATVKAGEKDAVFKEKAKKLVNVIGGAGRRIRKANVETHNYETRIVKPQGKDAGGVRVWRVPAAPMVSRPRKAKAETADTSAE